MKKIALITGILGVALAVLAYFADLNSWMSTEKVLTIGFIGYVMGITAVAYFLLTLIYKWSQ
ncbi:hypothetical protein LX64_04083 [Chitinophaga skermanii]|uniref:Uncharacterized protein n=1 Tax=Chitinophaga skermanii TaxID=331697 RepID=A0A327Q7A9_9BACT|nr:hypothetical protein [Chitinophaga skermanii]RAJ00379.1 hypothetical protein LX64_04083 [Chitinophaga skermanii]